MDVSVTRSDPGNVVDVPDPGLVRLTHIIYLLHSISVMMGIATSATVVGTFVFSLPSVVAVVLNYAKRSETRGTYLESHFRWQIRTFWFAFLWIVVALLLAFTVLGLPLALVLVAGAGLWVIYRVGRGWLALNDRRPMPI